MLPATVDSLVNALRGRPILTSEQFTHLERVHAPSHTDSHELARTLIRQSVLTIYQAKKLIAGKADELIVGPYVVLDKLGEGGMGRVYKARQLNLNRIVALKVVRTQLLKSETALKRFEREVKAAAALKHPNIVAVFDADEVGDRHYLAMEFIEGCDLAKVVKDRGKLPVAMACSYVRQAALGLQHAHNRGLIHRDVKPSNLLVAVGADRQFTEKNVVKVLDMGLARTRAEEEIGENPSTELTRAGTVIGTPDYMSPEQAKDSREVDHRSDLYSLGCTLYHLLAGDVPFPNGTPVEKLLQHQLDSPQPIQQLRPDVPSEVATIVHCLLEKKAINRFQSGTALAHALEPWCQSIAQSGFNSRPPLLAEPADSSSAMVDTPPDDPFDFHAPAGPPVSATPIAVQRLSPVSQPGESRKWTWLRIMGLGAMFVVFVMVGAIGATIILSGRKHEEPSKTEPPVLPKSIPDKSAASTPTSDPLLANDLDVLEKFLPDDSAIAAVFDVKQWQNSLTIRQLVLVPLAEKLAPIRRATNTDFLSAVERVVVGLPPNDRDAVIIFQGRSLVTPRLIEGLKTIPGVTAEPTSENQPELMRMSTPDREGTLYLSATGTSVVLSASQQRVREAMKKRDGVPRTRIADPTLARALEYSTARPFAAYVAIGLRQEWAKQLPAANKLNFLAAAIAFDERGMHFHTLADETESGKVAEIQKAFGQMIAVRAKETIPPNLRLERIARLVLDAEPSRFTLPKVRLTQLHNFIPTRRLEEWFAPFLSQSDG